MGDWSRTLSTSGFVIPLYDDSEDVSPRSRQGRLARMRRVLLALTCAAALCAPSATPARQAAGVPVATSCAGSVIVKVKGTSVRAGSIRTTKVSCTAGKALIGRLL